MMGRLEWEGCREFFHVTSIALGWGGVNFGEGGMFFFLTSICLNALSLLVPILTVRLKLTNLNFE